MRWILLICAVFLVPIGVSAAPNLTVERALWGFSGKAIPEAFNILTIEVRNASAEPYQGVIQLVKTLGSRSVGIPEIHPIGLAPGGARTVQFTPYIDAQVDVYEWRVDWKNGSMELGDLGIRLNRGSPETVALIEDTNTFGKGGEHFPSFPDRYFPTNVSVTNGLASVVLAHVPRWEEARANAFWQWLQRGGTLHLFLGQDGQGLEFSGKLSALNDTTVSTVGYGRVRRHAQRLNALTRSQSKALLTPRRNTDYRDQGRESVWRAFGSATLPDIPWGWIYAGAFAYLILIGPGHYFFGRNSRRDYRVTILALIAIVGVFSWVFTKIGRRGYGESDRWLSAAIARPLGDGTFDVQQWSHAFVTKSESYQFRHASAHQLFEVQHQMDTVPGFRQGGAQGYLSLDLPLFTSRNMISQAVGIGPDIQVKIARWSSQYPMRLEAEILGDAAIEKAWLRLDNQYFNLEKTGSSKWEVDRKDNAWEERTYLAPSRYRGNSVWMHLHQDIPNWLLSFHRHAHDQIGPVSEHAELILYAKSPDTFLPTSPNFEDHFGRVIYVIPLANELAAHVESTSTYRNDE